MTTMTQVRYAQPEWFSRENKRFFGDVAYKVLHGKVSRKPYMVRSTYAWTDMFSQPRKIHYRGNRINDDLTIGKLLDYTFSNLDEVKEWLSHEIEEA